MRSLISFRGPLSAVLLSARLLSKDTAVAPTFVADPAWLKLQEGRARSAACTATWQ